MSVILWFVGINTLALFLTALRFATGRRAGFIGPGSVVLGFVVQAIGVLVVLSVGPVNLAGGFLIGLCVLNFVLLAARLGKRGTEIDSLGELVLLFFIIAAFTAPAFFV